MHLRAGHPGETYRDDDELSESTRQAHLELTKLRARILDGEVRTAVQEFQAVSDFVPVRDLATATRTADEAAPATLRRCLRGWNPQRRGFESCHPC
jgi:hypothetical protein